MWRERSLWPYLWKPWMASGLVFSAVFIVGFLVVVPLAGGIADRLGAAVWLGSWLGGLLYLGVWIFGSGAIYLAIVGLLSSFLWDELSRAIESRLGPTPTGSAGCGLQLADTIARLPFSILIAVIVILFGWGCFGLIGILAAGLLGLFDFTACAFLRRGHAFWGQWTRVWRAKGWASFTVVCGVVSLVPVVNVLLLPVFVAGGTLLARRILAVDGV